MGHDIPEVDITRRYFRSLDNFFGEYVFLAEHAVCYLNVDRDPLPVFTQQGPRRDIAEPDMLQILEQIQCDG